MERVGCSKDCPIGPINFLYTNLDSMRILITGKNGQVGTELARRYESQDDVVLTGRDECDLGSEASIRDVVRRVKPTVIINAGAYTAVDQAEKERSLCFAINATAPRVLAEEAVRLDALLIHYSTDYVFDGTKSGPYVETDPIHPLSVYGESKAAGEAAVAETGCKYLILRTSWVYGAHGKNFLRTMLRLGADRPELRVVDDQIGAPTSAAAIADATVRLVDSAPDASGIYHMTAAGSTSWYGFACAILSAAMGPTGPRMQPISGSEYPTPARRPANSVLANDKFARAFAFRLPSWQQQLDDVLAEMRVATQTNEVNR
jgi:dTDP-4-dehydrorhamnose reductase